MFTCHNIYELIGNPAQICIYGGSTIVNNYLNFVKQHKLTQNSEELYDRYMLATVAPVLEIRKGC